MMRVPIEFQAGSSAGCPACAGPVVLQGRVRGTPQPHKLPQPGATPGPATSFQAASQPAAYSFSSPGNPVTAPVLAEVIISPPSSPALPSWESLGDRIAECTREVRELREHHQDEAKRMEQTRKEILWKSPLTIS